MKLRKSLLMLLRSSWRTILFFTIFAAVSALFIGRTCEYFITSRELHREVEFYDPIGTIRADADRLKEYVKTESGFGSYEAPEGSDLYWEDSADTVPLTADDKEIIYNSRYVSMIDDRSVSAGLSEKYFTLYENPTQWSYRGTIGQNGSFGLFSVFIEGTVLEDYGATSQSSNGNGIHANTVKLGLDKIIAALPDMLEECQEFGSIDTKENTIDIVPYPQIGDERELSQSVQGLLKEGNRFFFAACYDFDQLWSNGLFQVPIYRLDNVKENYVETAPEFNKLEFDQYYKKYRLTASDLMKVIKSNMHTFNMVYTKDTSMLMGVAKENIYFTDGRGITPDDSKMGSRVCAISADLAEEYGFKIGDTIDLSLRPSSSKHEGSVYGSIITYIPDTTWHESFKTWKRQLNFPDSSWDASVVLDLPTTNETFEIVGIYSYAEHDYDNPECYPLNTIFVPITCLPEGGEESPDLPSTFTFRFKSANDVDAFLTEVGPFLNERGLEVVLYDRGYSYRSDSFAQMLRSSMIGMIVMGITALLAILLMTYLYIKQKKNDYAIMRALGTTKKQASSQLFQPLLALSAVGTITGTVIAWVTSGNATIKNFTKAIEEGVLPRGFAFDASITFFVPAIAGLVLIAVVAVVTYFGLNNLSKYSVLSLLQGSAQKTGKLKRSFNFSQSENTSAQPTGLVNVKLATEGSSVHVPHESLNINNSGQAGVGMSLRYILRHIRRNTLKSILALLLTVGMITALGHFSYIIAMNDVNIQTMYVTTEVDGYIVNNNGALELRIPYDAVEEFGNSDFVDSYYAEAKDRVYYVDPLFGSRKEKYYIQAFNDASEFSLLKEGRVKITYAPGYDSELFATAQHVCILSNQLMKTFGLNYGDAIRVTGIPIDSFQLKYKKEDSVALIVVGSFSGPNGDDVAESITCNLFVPLWAMKDFSDDFYQSDFFGKSACCFARYRMVGGKLPDFDLFRLHAADYFKKSADVNMNKLSFYLQDDELQGVIEPLVKNNALLKMIYPFAAAAIIIISSALFGLMILHSSREIAIMRILGTTKGKARFLLVAEQMALCLIGLLIGALVLLIWHGFSQIGVAAFVFGLFFAGCILGTVICSVLASNKSVISLLQVKE